MSPKQLKTLAFVLCFFSGISQGMCQTTNDDTTENIVRGQHLLPLSPVCYYYNSVFNSHILSRIYYVPVAYVTTWGQWITDSAYNDDGQLVMPVFSHPDNTSLEYENYFDKVQVIVSAHDNLLEISTRGSSLQGSVTQAKLYYDEKGKPFLGVKYIHYGNPKVLYEEFHFFTPDGSSWKEVTNSIIKLPDTAMYFGKQLNARLAAKYEYIGVDIAFHSNSDTINLAAFKEFDLLCEDKSAALPDAKMKKAEKKELCDIFNDENSSPDGFTNKKIPYVFNKKTARFEKILTRK